LENELKGKDNRMEEYNIRNAITRKRDEIEDTLFP